MVAVKEFQQINRGYNSVFKANKLSLGLCVPIEEYSDSAVPSMTKHVERVKLAEELGFSAVWLRDVPFNVPSFGDAGQIYDPFVLLGLLAGTTNRIALGVASIVLPLRHPLHVAKAAASVDVLSGGRLILGVASGDRPQEYPSMNIPFETRADKFRDSFTYIRQIAEPYPSFSNSFGAPDHNMDLLPKPHGSKIPMLITGSSRQAPEWIAQNGDGWITYPRPIPQQAQIINEYRSNIEKTGSPTAPVMQPLYVDLVLDDADADPVPIHLGYRAGINFFKKHIRFLQEIGVNHVALNLRFNTSDIETTLRILGEELLPEFQS